MEKARGIWWHQVEVAGWLEAFAAHPRIGDVEGLKKKFGGFADMSKNEQAGAAQASITVIENLAAWNAKYEEKFGHIFIICASGKSAASMLDAVKARYVNTPYKELSLAAAEQMKITEIRLRQMVGEPPVTNAASQKAERRSGQTRAHLDGKPLTSPITSHVLDTARGAPAEGVTIILERKAPESTDIWESVSQGVTNSDGRVPNLLTPSPTIEPGIYKVTFETEEYMRACKSLHPAFYAEKPFYPAAAVQFEILPSQTRQHFHIPLTWNPYGYSTYRGS